MWQPEEDEAKRLISCSEPVFVDLKKQVESLETELKRSEEAQKKALEQRHVALDAHNTIAQDKHALETRLKELNAKLIQEERKNETLTSQMHDLEKKHKDFLEGEALRHENKCLKEELEKCGRLTSDLTSEVAAAHREKQHFVDELDHSFTRNENLRFEVQRLTKLIEKSAHDANATKEELIHKCNKINEEMHKEHAKIDSLDRFNERLKGELIHANALIDNLRDENEQILHSKKTLMSQIDSLKKEKDCVAHSSHRLGDALLHLTHSKKELHHEAKKEADEVTHLRALLAEEKAVNESLTAKLAQACDEVDTKRAEMVAVSDTNKALMAQLAEFGGPKGKVIRTEDDKLKEQLQEMQTRLIISSSVNEELQSTNNKLQAELNKHLTEQSKLCNENKAQTEKIARLSKEVYDLEHQLSTKNAECKHLQHQQHSSAFNVRKTEEQMRLADFETR
jgi:chromosome segregation ATPase